MYVCVQRVQGVGELTVPTSCIKSCWVLLLENQRAPVALSRVSTLPSALLLMALSCTHTCTQRPSSSAAAATATLRQPPSAGHQCTHAHTAHLVPHHTRSPALPAAAWTCLLPCVVLDRVRHRPRPVTSECSRARTRALSPGLRGWWGGVGHTGVVLYKR